MTLFTFIIVRFLISATFAVNVFAQIGAILHTPNKDPIYGPNVIAFALLVFTQGVLQMSWLWGFSFPESSGVALPTEEDDCSESPEETEDNINRSRQLPEPQVVFLPIFIVESVCLALWSYAWWNGKYMVSQLISMFNTAVHMVAMYWLLPKVTAATSISPTHLLSRTSMAVAILFMWQTWGVIDKTTTLYISERLQTGAFFLMLAITSGPEPTLNLCLMCDLIALILGPRHRLEWQATFVYIFTAVAIIIAFDYSFNWKRREEVVKLSNTDLEMELVEIEEELAYPLVELNKSSSAVVENN